MNKAIFATAGAVALSAFAAMADADAIAFYAFKDGASGASAAGATLANAAAPSSLEGTVTLYSSDASAAAAFDADAPGARIYSSYRPSAELLCVAPQSISISSDLGAVAKGASISFANASTELSRHHATGFTIEYFFKIENGASWNAYAAKANLSIYKDASSGTTKTFSLYLPCESEKTVRCGVGGYNSSFPMYVRNANLSAVNDGKWHHVAIVQTTGGDNGYLEVWYDRTRYIYVAVPASLSRTEVDDGKALSLACNAFVGKIACVRMTARALGKDDFMYASKREQAVNDNGVLAFYPFDDDTVGASAVGTNKVRNAVNPVMCAGHVVKYSSGSPSITWDSDSPGTYVYAGKKPVKPIYVSPGSIHMTSGTTGSSGTIHFYDLGAKMSACAENGHTVEYFLKLDDSNFTGYSQSMWYTAGYFFNGEDSKGFSLYLPFSMSYASGREFRYSIGTYNGGHSTNRNLPFDLWNGAWHHVAVVQSRKVTAATGDVPASTNYFVTVYVDGIDYNTIQFDGIEPLTSGDLTLGNYAHHGKYSCLKVTNRALPPDEFLVATDTKRKGVVIIFQ